ncbi:terminal uridylyltransferase 4-like isoform X2 [Amphiura filiformis]|uniref:terminal uridylyltransferase 4-like isoform X2 n=1 Tax=Amphiura filiformis TaxID=82378 RepID=UPI003B20D1EC
MADTAPKTSEPAKTEQEISKSSTVDDATKSDKVDNTTKTEVNVTEAKKEDATVEKKEDKNVNEKKDNASEKKEDKATNEINKKKDDKTADKKKDEAAKTADMKKADATSNKSDDTKKKDDDTKKKDETVNKKSEIDKTSKKKEDEKTNKKNDEDKTNKKNDNSNTTKKNDNSKVANNINKTSSEGGKPRAGSAGNQGKNDQSKEQKVKRRQKEQERYQRKIQRGENKNAAKEGGAQKATPKTEEKKDSGGLSITVGGEGRTVTEKRDGKTVVEKKGENAIEAPETKQGGEALTEEEKKLEEHQIFRLAKKSLRFPKAKFYCRYCNYHLDTVDLAFKHVDESRHSKLEKTKKDQEFLRTLPPASDAHHEALTNLLTSVVDKHKLTQQELDQRAKIVSRVEQVLQKELPKCKVHLYGSSVSGFGFKDSNVNLDIQMPPDVTPAEILVGTDKAMHKHSSDVFTEVVTDFEGKFPCINFKDKKTGLQCQVGTNSAFAVDTSKLLREYYKLDARVPVLALALRYWAKLCKVDQQADGSMPAYAFVIMVIHYLQQCEPPVLPVIQEKETLKERNTKCAGELWLDLLKFYVVEMPIEEWVITIRNRKPISRQDMKIPNKRLAVEDPFATSKKNITKSLTTSIVFQYIMERLREALKYFGLPQYLPGKEPTASNCYSWFVHSKSPTSKSAPSGDKEKGTPNATDSTKATESTKDSTSVDDLAKDLSKKLVTEHTETHRTPSQNVTDSKAAAGKTSEKGNKDAVDGQKFGPAVSDFKFVFEKQILTGGEEVPLICSGCGLEGHVEKDCQDEVLIDLIPLPPMPPNFMHKIDVLCVNICEEVQVQRWEMEARDNIIWELQTHIRRNGFPDTNLRLFGSSMNGFGFHHSDLDICMTLEGARDPKSLNFPDIVEKLAKILKKNRSLYGITPIPTAKVPIVKFIHRPSRLEGDISLYNMLAQVNTKMLYCYSGIDTRVRQLVYAFKLFAKICDIGDASKGSLSSYAYTLMTLFFLQQRKPPVIPVLQELYTGKEKPKAMMEGRNAWFYDDVRNLSRVWKGYSKNRESVGQLWLGMLRFYTEDFDFKKHVITIRQIKPLTRFEKMWTAPSRGFAIEDPFDLDHNLGGGVSRKMATYMMQVLRKTRERFGLPRRIPPYTDDFDYFFDLEFLSDGKAPPNDRGCRVCGKIGHFVKECPRRRPKSGDSNDKKKEDARGTPFKHTRDASPKKPEPKGTPQKVPSDNTQSNKETPKKAAPEKEILKRDTSQQKTSNGKAAATPVSVTPVMSNSKAAQIHNTRPATLTPTTKPPSYRPALVQSPSQRQEQPKRPLVIREVAQGELGRRRVIGQHPQRSKGQVV